LGGGDELALARDHGRGVGGGRRKHDKRRLELFVFGFCGGRGAAGQEECGTGELAFAKRPRERRAAEFALSVRVGAGGEKGGDDGFVPGGRGKVQGLRTRAAVGLGEQGFGGRVGLVL